MTWLSWTTLLLILTILSPCTASYGISCGSGPTVCPKRKNGNCGYRPDDGSCSTPKDPKCGSTGSMYARLAPARYHGSHGFPLTTAGEQFPNARKLSVALFPLKETIDSRITLNVMQYGQLITHDLGFTSTNVSPLSCCSNDMHFVPPSKTTECASINVTEDPFYEEYQTTCVSMFRTKTNRWGNCSLWTSSDQPLTMVPSPMDLHVLYSKVLGDNLREYKNGLLATKIINNQEWLPDAPSIDAPHICFSVIKPKICYAGADPRTNQNTHLIVLELLYLRQHNRLARELSKINPDWCDERLYQEARRINIAIHQHISYYELLPQYMGEEYLYRNKILYKTRGFVNDYNENVCPANINEFSQGAFRQFHSMIVDKLKLISNNRTETGSISLKDWFDNPVIVEEHFDELAIGLNTQPSGASDIYYIPQIKDNLFPKYKKCGLDLRAIDIQRGRDHGLSSYNTMRGWCGFKKAKSFEDFSDHINPSRIEQLKFFYKNVEDVELVVGGSYEDSVTGALAGPVFLCIMREQFYRTRVGDPFWYERGECGFSLEQLQEIRKSSMAMMVCNHGHNITQMQLKAFLTISDSNPLLPCYKIPQIDLNKWKDYSAKTN